VPQRGIHGIADLKCDSALILAPFPPVEGYPAFDDEKILATFASLQDAVRGVRDLRSSANVPPKDRPAVTVVVPPDRIGAFESQAHIVRHMAGIGTLNVAAGGKRPKNAGSITIGSTRIFVHDISDDDAERARSAKALEAVEKQIAGKESKLSNEKFVANAKPEVVEAERQRLSELLAERAALTAHLRDLTE
jgi:valyl-tRNA synthetase